MTGHIASDANAFIHWMTGTRLQIALPTCARPWCVHDYRAGMLISTWVDELFDLEVNICPGASIKKRLDFQFLTHTQFFNRDEPAAFPPRVCFPSLF